MSTDELSPRVRAAATRVEQAVDAVAAAQKALHAEALTAVMALDGDDERALVRHLYWNVPALPVTALQAVVGGQSRVRELAQPGPPLGPCDVCGSDVHARSRSDLTTSIGPLRCRPCERHWRYRPPDPPPPAPEWDLEDDYAEPFDGL